MRLICAATAAVVLAATSAAFAQVEWIDFVSKEDGFHANFPGQPKVEQITWTSQYGYKLPARVYSATLGPDRYSVTVVDYSSLEKQGEARAAQCPAGAEPCRGNQVAGPIGAGYWKMDMRGALAFAVFKFLQRDAKVTDFNYQFQELVEGYFVQMTNPDKSRTMAYITMHEHRLYIWEGTVPEGRPEPGLFLGAVSFVDAEGNTIRYQSIYSNAYHGLREVPVPPRAGRGGGGRGAPGGGPAGGAAAPAGGRGQ
jgi:hypothetical protein